MKMYSISKKEVKKYARTYMYEIGACCWYISNEKKSCFASNLPKNELQTMELLLRCMIVHDELVALNHSKTEKECDSVKTAKLAVRDWDTFLKMIKKSCRKCLCRRWVKKIEKIDINIRKKVCRFIAENMEILMSGGCPEEQYSVPAHVEIPWDFCFIPESYELTSEKYQS